jgi:hypothetical protein
VTVSGLYRVVGSRGYREHQPGDLFEAKLDDRAEARAIGRGNIVLLERLTIGIQPGTFTFPQGWLTETENTDGEANCSN